MKASNLLSSLLLAITAYSSPTCSNPTDPEPPASTPPVNYGIMIFPAFQSLDVFGPLDSLNLFSMQRHINLFIIAPTLDPVSTRGRAAHSNLFNSSFSESVVPTHTFANPPPNIDVLIVPGGIATVAPDRAPWVDFIRTTYPKVKYLMTICTGAHLAAEAGVLDGKKATTNKRAWAKVGTVGPKTTWIAKARWHVDGNIWTSSGVSAGIDCMFAFIREMYGVEKGRELALGLEYDAHEDASWDPFSEHYNLTDVYPVEN